MEPNIRETFIKKQTGKSILTALLQHLTLLVCKHQAISNSMIEISRLNTQRSLEQNIMFLTLIAQLLPDLLLSVSNLTELLLQFMKEQVFSWGCNQTSFPILEAQLQSNLMI